MNGNGQIVGTAKLLAINNAALQPVALTMDYILFCP